MTIDITPIQVPLAVGVINVTSLTFRTINDNFSTKKVFAVFSNGSCATLWEGDEYDAIGNWTDDDVIERIQSLATDMEWVRSIIV